MTLHTIEPERRTLHGHFSRDLPPALTAVLPDGFTMEVSPAASQWWSEACRLLRRGRILALDYGATAEELFRPERPEGTLRAYSRHQFAPYVLASPGDQDLTAHVNFSAIRRVGGAHRAVKHTDAAGLYSLLRQLGF